MTKNAQVKDQIRQYLLLKKELREREKRIEVLREQFQTFLKKREETSISYDGVGKVSLVEREIHRLNEAKLMRALKTESLEKYKDTQTVEAVFVTAA